MKKKLTLNKLSYIIPTAILSTSLISCVALGTNGEFVADSEDSLSDSKQKKSSISASNGTNYLMTSATISAGGIYQSSTSTYSARLSPIAGGAYGNTTISKGADTLIFNNANSNQGADQDVYKLPDGTYIPSITMLDFNNDSGQAIPLNVPGYYNATNNENTLEDISSITIRDLYHGNTSATSPLNQVGFYCFSGNARLYSGNNLHGYYEPTPGAFKAENGETMWKNLTNLTFGEAGDSSKISLKVIHAGAFSDNTAISTIDFGADNQITYLDELTHPSIQQINDYSDDPVGVPRPIYADEGGDFVGDVYRGRNPGIFENAKNLHSIDLHQGHMGEYVLKSYLKNIPAKAFKDAVNLTSLNGSSSDAFYLPNSVQTIGELAFDNMGTGSSLSTFVFPEPDSTNGDTGVTQCANNIFGDLSAVADNYLTDIYFPELNPSDSLLNGLFNSLSTLNVNHNITFHIPFDITDTSAYQHGTWDPQQSTIGKKLINNIGTRHAVYIAPKSYDFITPNLTKSFPFGGVTTNPQYFNTLFDPTSSTNGWSNRNTYWTISTSPHNAYFAGSDINSNVSINTSFGSNLNYGDSTTKFDELNATGTDVAKYEYDSELKHYVWKFAPKFTVVNSLGTNTTTDVTITVKSASASVQTTSALDSVGFWNIEPGTITYSDGQQGNHNPIAQNILAGGTPLPAPSINLVTTVALQGSMPVGLSILDKVDVRWNLNSYQKTPSDPTTSPPAGWDDMLSFTLAAVGGTTNALTITPKFTQPANDSLLGIYKVQYEVFFKETGVTLQTSDQLEFDLWGITGITIPNQTYNQYFDGSASWDASHEYDTPIATFVYGNGFKPVGSGQGYPSETFTSSINADSFADTISGDLENWNGDVTMIGNTTTVSRSGIPQNANYAGTLSWTADFVSKDAQITVTTNYAFSWEKYGDVKITPTVDPATAGAFSVNGQNDVSVVPIAIGNHSTTNPFGTLTLEGDGVSDINPSDWTLSIIGDTTGALKQHMSFTQVTGVSDTMRLVLISDDWSNVPEGTYNVSITLERKVEPPSQFTVSFAMKIFKIDASINTNAFTNPASIFQDGTETLPGTALGTISSMFPVVDSEAAVYNWSVVGAGGVPANFLTLTPSNDGKSATVAIANNAYQSIGSNFSFEFKLTITIVDSAAAHDTINDGISSSYTTTSGYSLNLFTTGQPLHFTSQPHAKYFCDASTSGSFTGDVFSYNDDWANPQFSYLPNNINPVYKVYNFWKLNETTVEWEKLPTQNIFTIDQNTGNVTWKKTSSTGAYKFDVGLEIYFTGGSTTRLTYCTTNSDNYDPSASSTWISADGCNFEVELSSGEAQFSTTYTEETAAPFGEYGNAIIDGGGNVLVVVPGNSSFDPSNPSASDAFFTLEITIPYVRDFTDIDLEDWAVNFIPVDTSVGVFDDGQFDIQKTNYVKPSETQAGHMTVEIRYDFSSYTSGFFNREFDYIVTLDAKAEDGNYTRMYTSSEIRQFVSKPTDLSASFNYNGKILNNGDKIKIADSSTHQIVPTFTADSDPDFYQISPLGNEWAEFLNQLYLDIDVSYNGKIIELPDDINISFETNPASVNYGNLYITVDKSMLSKEYYGLYAINITFDWFDVNSTGQPLNLSFGFVLDLEKPKPNHTGEIVGIVIGAIAGVAGVGIGAKILANKARARKLLREDREDEKEDGKEEVKLTKSSKSGF